MVEQIDEVQMLVHKLQNNETFYPHGNSLSMSCLTIFIVINFLINGRIFCYQESSYRQVFNLLQSLILMRRLSDTRWIDEIENSKWEYGTKLNYLQELCTYWQNDDNWRKNEDFLNTFAHFKTIINGQGHTFYSRKGKGEQIISNSSYPLVIPILSYVF